MLLHAAIVYNAPMEKEFDSVCLLTWLHLGEKIFSVAVDGFYMFVAMYPVCQTTT
jgi:hypothetical protein